MRMLPVSTEAELDNARSIASYDMQRGRWVVLRNGGTGRGLRVAFSSPSEPDAREQFDRLRKQMRQGSLLLLGPDSALHDYASEPMARRRW
jgi:hypothetical protein